MRQGTTRPWLEVHCPKNVSRIHFTGRMSFKELMEVDLKFFQTLLGTRSSVSLEDLEKYSRDETEDISILPQVVLKPETPEEVSAILRYCNEQNICVTPSGARTGLSGGAIPVHRGVAMSMERFNKILHIDEQNHQVTTEPGVITQVLQDAVREKGLFYPPDPASRGG